MLRAPHRLKSARLRHAGARRAVELASTFDASIGGVAVEGCDGVSKNRDEYRCGVDDSAKGMLMGPGVDFEGVELKCSRVLPIIVLVGVATSICAKGPPPGLEACTIHRTRRCSMGRVSRGERPCSNDDRSVGRASVMRGKMEGEWVARDGVVRDSAVAEVFLSSAVGPSWSRMM